MTLVCESIHSEILEYPPGTGTVLGCGNVVVWSVRLGRAVVLGTPALRPTGCPPSSRLANNDGMQTTSERPFAFSFSREVWLGSN